VLPSSASADAAGTLQRFASNIFADAMIVVDAGDVHLNAVLLFSTLYERKVHVRAAARIHLLLP